MLTDQPRKGQRIAWRMDGELRFHGTVLRTEGNLCWMNFDDGTTNPFIWLFKDGLNQLAEVTNTPESAQRVRQHGATEGVGHTVRSPSA